MRGVDNESQVPLLITHPHPHERQGYEVGKIRKNKERTNGRPSRKGQEYIVNESHRHTTRKGGGARRRLRESEKLPKIKQCHNSRQPLFVFGGTD